MILGLCFEKERFRASWVDGTKAAPILHARERISNPHANDLSQSASWLYGRIEQLVRQRAIDSIISKISLDLNSKDKVLNHGFPLGIVALRAHQDRIGFSIVTKNMLNRHTTFGLAAGANPQIWVDHLRDNSPYWDVAAKDATLAAISGL